MKSNKVTIISSLFLMTALCGCTTQSVDKAKEIEESNTYVYKYEYETNTEGQAETQYHEEKPSFDDFETVTKGTIASLRNKNGSLKLIKMNEVYEWGVKVHLSREVCCRLFKKMTGKTITGYLEEYRVNKSFSLVQSGQYSMTQITEMVGFSNPSRFASAFRKRFGCNPGEYNSVKH